MFKLLWPMSFHLFWLPSWHVAVLQWWLECRGKVWWDPETSTRLDLKQCQGMCQAVLTVDPSTSEPWLCLPIKLGSMSRFLLFCLDSTFFNSSQQDAFGPKLLRDTGDAGADIQRIQLCCSVQTMHMVPNGSSVTVAPASALKMQRTIGPINIRAKPCYRYQNTPSRPWVHLRKLLMGGVSITHHTSRYPMGGWTLQIYRSWWVIPRRKVLT